MRPLFVLFALAALTGCNTRHIRTAVDATCGNPKCTELDWKYGANDIRIQTSKITRVLVDRWAYKTGYRMGDPRPSLIITQIDNRTDMYISSDMIRDIIEGVAINDGRFSVVVGDVRDERELDNLICKQQELAKYNNPTRLCPFDATAPHFLAKIRLTKAVTATPRHDIEDYRMTITLYDIATQECIDQASDTLRKFVQP